MQQMTIPGGRSKGTPLDQATTQDIRYWLARRTKELAEDPRGEFAAANQRWIDAARAELQRREAGGQQQAPAEQPPQQAPSTAIARTSAELATMSHDPAAITERLREYSERFHLVSPATAVDALPPGCSVAVSLVAVNPSTEKGGPGDVYEVGGKLGLSGNTLKRIAAAAGVDWDPVQSGRLDDGRDPNYAHYRAVGRVRSFDGSIRTVTGECEIDARDGSPLIEEIRTKAANATDRDGNARPRDPTTQIIELRKFLLRHAESKAKNRAIADLGVKRAYAPAELSKPFAVARMMWTGATDDPELRRELALRTQAAMMGASAALYGPPRQPRQLGPARHPAPPVGVTEADFEDAPEAW